MMSAVTVSNGHSAGPMRNDRRRNPRYSFVADVEIIDLESGMKMKARTSDFSRGGCYVDMFSPLPEGAVVTLRIMKLQQTLETQAKVVYSSVGVGMGLMFGVPDAKQRAIVETWLTQLWAVRLC